MEETILFVDDEQNILDALVMIFRAEGFKVLTAESAAKGLELIRKNRVSVVISDHKMPGMDGLQFLSLVREVAPETVRCLLTAYADLRSSVPDIKESEVYRYIMKPWDPNELKRIVREASQRYRRTAGDNTLNDALARNAGPADIALMYRADADKVKGPAGAKTILVADDSVFFRTKLSDILVEAGHRVRLARDGKEVMDSLTSDARAIDLVILDLQAPDIDGLGVLQWMNAGGLSRKPPVLATTGAYETADITLRLRSLGATGLLSKGFTPEQIIFRVNRVLFPENTAKINKWKRVPVSIPVDFTDGGRTRTGFFLNLSETGAFLYTNAELRKGPRLVLKFTIPGLGKVFEIIGNVKWATGEVHGRTLFGGYGIVFNAISHVDRQILREFIIDEAVKIETDNYQ